MSDGLVAFCTPEGAIQVQDIASGQPRQTLRGHMGDVTALAFSWEGLILGSVGTDRTARLWEVRTGAPLGVLRTPQTFGDTWLTFDPRGRYVVTGGRGGQSYGTAWDLRTQSRIAWMEQAGLGIGAFLPDGTGVLVGSLHGSVLSWKMADIDKVRAALGPAGPGRTTESPWPTRRWSCRAATPIQSGASPPARTGAGSPPRRTTRPSSCGTPRRCGWYGRSKATTASSGASPSAPTRAISLRAGRPASRSGRSPPARTCTTSRITRKWSRRLPIIPAAPGWRRAAMTGPSGFASCLPAAASAGCTPSSVRSTSSPFTPMAAGWPPAATIITSPSGTSAAKPPSPRPPDRRLAGHAGPVRAVGFSGDGRVFASGSEQGVIILWDGDSLERVVQLKGGTGQIRGLSFNRDGRLLAGAAYNARTIVWDVDRLRQALRDLQLDW